MDVVVSIFAVAMVLFLWLNTDAFVEYATLLNLIDFSEYHTLYNGQHYTTYLLDRSIEVGKVKAFGIKLIACPKCLGVWLSLVASLIVGVIWLPIIYCMSLTVYAYIAKLEL